MAKKENAGAVAPEPDWSGRKFRRKPVIVEAEQIHAGLWRLEGGAIYEDEEFREKFEPVADEEQE